MDEQNHDFSERPYSRPSPAMIDSENDEQLAACISLPHANPFRWLFGGGALFLPFVGMATFIIVTREWIILDTLWDYLGIGLSVASGLLCVWQLPLPRLPCAVISIIYIPVVGLMQFGFTFEFVGWRYGWL